MTTFPWHHRGEHRPAAGTTSTSAGSQSATEAFWQVLWLGLITAAFGIAVLAWPSHTLHLISLLAGVWLVVAGALRLAGAFKRDATVGRRLVLGSLGILLIVGGIACLRNLATGVTILAGIIGLAWLLSGMAQVAIGLLARGALRIWLVAVGAASLLVGLAFLLWPGLSLAAMVLLTGITALIIGVAEVTVAFQLKGAGSDRTAATPHDGGQLR
ncbi:HdeD family acid-resistance protein [Dactylosporangium matsuzakiense]|uniref:HdeD family acid-resistance protein n=1 Tax=Dactylosporangium matsuzakiense TaxID=53360 RepID=A0A9W6NIX7_9ACTN|nr:DUF308 domain-containing protein [Dactylosporangium matsuzakiense]GLK99334.1 hypothetical protein GCM10017581_010750 [Dactylosporangium matsuzakiense]